MYKHECWSKFHVSNTEVFVPPTQHGHWVDVQVIILAISLMSKAIQRAAINRHTHALDLEEYTSMFVLLLLLSVRLR